MKYNYATVCTRLLPQRVTVAQLGSFAHRREQERRLREESARRLRNDVCMGRAPVVPVSGQCSSVE